MINVHKFVFLYFLFFLLLFSYATVSVNATEEKYVIFIDSDDYVSDDYLENIYKYTNNEQNDMVIVKAVNFIDGNELISPIIAL